MDTMIKQENFLNNLFSLYDETFENHHGICLDNNTSLLTPLETVSAQEASIPVGGKCASLAAQVTHVIFYLELLEKYFLKQEVGKVDWGEIWRTLEKISPDDWETLKNKLRQTYTRLDSYSTKQRTGMTKTRLVPRWQSLCLPCVTWVKFARCFAHRSEWLFSKYVARLKSA